MEIKRSCLKQRMIVALTILSCSILAILAHAILPAPVEIDQFNSIFIKLFGFPAVGTFYFVFLFTYCALSIRYIGVRFNVSKFNLATRFGIAYSIIYLIGMQEVVVEGSPFKAWGSEFVTYQFYMGLGDAIPAILLCFIISYFTIDNKTKTDFSNKIGFCDSVKIVSIVTVALLIVRIIGYESGIITSNFRLYPLPCIVWTVLFGMGLGSTYVILFPLLSQGGDIKITSFRHAIIIGVNWIIFNTFIGLIFKDTMPEMLLKSGLDVITLYVTIILTSKFLMKKPT